MQDSTVRSASTHDRRPADTLTRRRFLTGAAGATGALALGLGGTGSRALARKGAELILPPALPASSLAGFKHVVVVMMENRSFDHFLGWLPGANGAQAGLTYFDGAGNPHPTFPLATDLITGDFQGCGSLDPGHSYGDGRVQYHNGAADGWLLPGSAASDTDPNQANDLFAIGYYPQAALSFYSAAAPAWTTCDRYFSGILAETYPNRFHMHSAQTDRLVNTSTISTLPTIWDRLQSRGLTGRYYYSDIPFLALWGAKYLRISKGFSEFLADAAAGRLPNVSFIDPRFIDEGSGTSGDDHPHADIRNGQAFLNTIYNAVTTSPNWPDTVFIINYDEWGGFYDHVPPPLAPIPPASAAAGDTDGRFGFRTPCLVFSPLAKRGFVSSTSFDHTSILRMIEWRWSLPPLCVRDQTANNFATVLDFNSPKNLVAPVFTVPPGPFGIPCPGDQFESSEEFGALRDLARSLGFPIF